MLIVEARSSFALQLTPFLVFILGGSWAVGLAESQEPLARPDDGLGPAAVPDVSTQSRAT